MNIFNIYHQKLWWNGGKLACFYLIFPLYFDLLQMSKTTMVFWPTNTDIYLLARIVFCKICMNLQSTYLARCIRYAMRPGCLLIPRCTKTAHEHAILWPKIHQTSSLVLRSFGHNGWHYVSRHKMSSVCDYNARSWHSLFRRASLFPFYGWNIIIWVCYYYGV